MQPPDEAGDRRLWRHTEPDQISIAQNAVVTAMQALHLHNEFGFHDQSSSASRVTAGAFGLAADRPYGRHFLARRSLLGAGWKVGDRGGVRDLEAPNV